MISGKVLLYPKECLKIRVCLNNKVNLFLMTRMAKKVNTQLDPHL